MNSKTSRERGNTPAMLPTALILAAVSALSAAEERGRTGTKPPSDPACFTVPASASRCEQAINESRRAASDESVTGDETARRNANGDTESTTWEGGQGEAVRRYITREEKLEAGQRREITRWLYATTLAEYEWSSERRSGTARAETDKSSVLTLQGGLQILPADYIQSEIVLEYDSEADETIVDELVAAVSWEDFEIEAGKQGLPFGEYYSRFATGPLIEFGETTETALKLSYELGDLVDLSLTAYEGPATDASGKGSDIDYVAAIESQPVEQLSLGLSHLTDLADSDEGLLRHNGDLFRDKVSALNAYAFWVGGDYELSLEYVSALDRFRELDEEVDKPMAWNLELGLFVMDDLDLAFRLEGSSELEEAPARQVGLAATALLHERATLTFELLHGRFKEGFVTDDEDNPFDHVTTVGIQFSAAF